MNKSVWLASEKRLCDGDLLQPALNCGGMFSSTPEGHFVHKKRASCPVNRTSSSDKIGQSQTLKMDPLGFLEYAIDRLADASDGCL